MLLSSFMNVVSKSLSETCIWLFNRLSKLLSLLSKSVVRYGLASRPAIERGSEYSTTSSGTTRSTRTSLPVPVGTTKTKQK